MAAGMETKKVTWREERRTLTLTGEPVLELALSWPEIEGKQMGNAHRYYQKLREVWKKHWKQEGYWKACADLAQQREKSRPFRVWSAELSGQVRMDREGVLSIAMCAREVQGDGRALEYRWGDTWRWEDGSVVTLKEQFECKKGWKKRLEQALDQGIQRCRQEGVCLDENLQGPLHRWCSGQRFAVSEEGIEIYFPQCTIAPAVEGAVVCHLPMLDGIRITKDEKGE